MAGESIINGLLSENIALRKQLLGSYVQNTMMIKQLESFCIATNLSIHNISREVVSRAVIEKWVREINENERQQMKDLRDSARAEVVKLKSLVGDL